LQCDVGRAQSPVLKGRDFSRAVQGRYLMSGFSP
jgi:hypothetical protein